MNYEDPEEPEYETTPYEHYWWDCPACGCPNDAGDVEPSGAPETCDNCDAKVTVSR